jgi:hypothetical protein
MSADGKEDRRPNYEVGYGKPPVSTRFQRGQSGNPEGGRRRKKQSKKFSDLFRDQLSEMVTVNIGGRQKRMTRFEALTRGVIADALKGKERVRKQVIDWLIALESRGDTPATEATTSKEDLEILQAFLERNQGRTLESHQPTTAKERHLHDESER